MKVGILGSGDVAKSLAGGFLKHGHQVMLGTRDAAKLKDFVAQHKGAQTGSFADAAKFGELVVLAVKGSVALDALKAAGAANMAGKPVIDATNPIADAPPANGVLEVLYQPRSVADGAAAGGTARCAFRQGVQFRRQRGDDQPEISRRQADHVHLRQRR